MVSGAVMFGRAQNQCGVLIEPSGEYAVDNDTAGALTAFKDAVWSVIIYSLPIYSTQYLVGQSSRKRTKLHLPSLGYSRRWSLLRTLHVPFLARQRAPSSANSRWICTRVRSTTCKSFSFVAIFNRPTFLFITDTMLLPIWPKETRLLLLWTGPRRTSSDGSRFKPPPFVAAQPWISTSTYSTKGLIGMPNLLGAPSHV